MPFSHSKASVPPHRHNGMISHSPNRSENTKKEHESQSPGSLQHSLRLSSDASKTYLQPCGGVRIPSNYDPTTIEAMYAMQYCQNRTITFLHFRGWTRHKHLQNRSSWMNVPTLGWTTYEISSCVASSLMIVAISAFLKKFGKKENLDFGRYPEEVANIGKDRHCGSFQACMSFSRLLMRLPLSIFATLFSFSRVQ